MPEMSNLLLSAKMRHRRVADKPEVVVYFGLLLILTR